MHTPPRRIHDARHNVLTDHRVRHGTRGCTADDAADDPAEGAEDFKELESRLVRLMDELKKNDKLDETFDARAPSWPSNQGGSKESQNSDSKAKRVSTQSAKVTPTA